MQDIFIETNSFGSIIIIDLWTSWMVKWNTVPVGPLYWGPKNLMHTKLHCCSMEHCSCSTGHWNVAYQEAIYKAQTLPSRHRQWDLVDQAVGGLTLSLGDSEHFSFKWNYKPEQSPSRRKSIALQAVQEPWTCSRQKVPSKVGGTLWNKALYTNCFGNCHQRHELELSS